MLKLTSRIVAIVLLIGAACIVGFGLLRARSKSTPPTAPASTAEFGAPPDASDGGESSGLGSAQDLIALSDEGTWTRIDPETGRPRSKMTWKSLDPAGKGTFRIGSPRIWMIDGDRTLRLESATADVVWPSRNEAPESGTLTGDVVLTVFDGEGSDDATLNDFETIGTAHTQTMRFSQISRELAASGDIAIDALGWHATGSGLLVRFGPDRSMPVPLLRVDHGGTIEYQPEAAPPARADAKNKATGTQDNGAPGAESPQTYRLTMNGGVNMDAGGRSISTDEPTLLARTFGGRLRESAVASFERTDGASAGGQGDAGTPRGGTEQTKLTWTGAMELRATREVPPELAQDDLVVRLSRASSPVRVVDRASGQRVTAEMIEYSATSRRLRAAGDAEGIEAEIPDVARVRVRRFEMDLTTGAGVIMGGGEAVLIGKAARDGLPATQEGSRRMEWSDRAEFTLDTATGPVGSSESAVLTQARLDGGVRVQDGEAALSADGLRLFFDHVPGGEGASTLTRLAATGNARANDARDGVVRGEHIDVLFEPDAKGTPVPTIATVREGARADRGGDSLAADTIEALLTRTPGGEVGLASVEALDHVVAVLARKEGTITARARSLRADAAIESADLIGEPVTIERSSTNGSGTLSGPSMRIEAREGTQRLTIFGAGKAGYDLRNNDKATRIEVGWTGGVVYTDATGRAEVEGGAHARIESGADERHTASGERIVIDLTSAADAASNGGERQLVRTLIEGRDESPAEVELRRYVAGTLAEEEGTLEGLAFLRGPTVELFGATSRLRVEGPGLLLLEDRRPEGAATGSGNDSVGGSPAPITFNGKRGTTLFSWAGGLNMDRAAGTGEITDEVLIRHKDATTSEIAEIACARATMKIAESGEPSGPLEAMTLTEAVAEGGVTAQYKALQLSSARLVYEASGRITVTSEPRGSITIYDRDKGRTVSGEAAIVDTATGVYRIEKMESIAVPR